MEVFDRGGDLSYVSYNMGFFEVYGTSETCVMVHLERGKTRFCSQRNAKMMADTCDSGTDSVSNQSYIHFRSLG